MGVSERESPGIIYNVAGGILRSVRSKDFRQLGEWLREAGFEGISALPFRTEDIVRLYRNFFPPIVLVEDAWNPGQQHNLILAGLEGLHGQLRRLLGDQTEPPKLQDTMFYPPRGVSERIASCLMRKNPWANFGSLSFDSRFPSDRTLVHVQSQFRSHALTADEIIRLADENRVKLLFDPEHLLSPTSVSMPGEPTRQYQGEWERQLIRFKDLIAGVDIHPANSQEMVDLLKQTGRMYELAIAAQELCVGLKFLRVETVIPIVAQLPMSPFQQRAIRHLSDIVEALKVLRK